MSAIAPSLGPSHLNTIYPDIHTLRDWLSWQLFDVSRTEWATVLIKNHKFKHWYLDLCARFSRLSIDPSIDCQSVRIIDLMNANGPKCRLRMYMLNIVWIFFPLWYFQHLNWVAPFVSPFAIVVQRHIIKNKDRRIPDKINDYCDCVKINYKINIHFIYVF